MAMRAPAVGRPVFTVLDGGRGQYAEEARVEVLAFLAEVERDATAIHNAEIASHIPSAQVVNLAGRLAHRAVLARREYLSLLPDGDAA